MSDFVNAVPSATLHKQHKHTGHAVYILSFVFHPGLDHKHDYSDLASRF